MTAGGKQFKGFESVHFDAYEKRKWSSNRFNLERMAVREQAEALMAEGVDSLGDAATNLPDMPLLSTDTGHAIPPSSMVNVLIHSGYSLLAREMNSNGFRRSSNICVPVIQAPRINQFNIWS